MLYVCMESPGIQYKLFLTFEGYIYKKLYFYKATVLALFWSSNINNGFYSINNRIVL